MTSIFGRTSYLSKVANISIYRPKVGKLRLDRASVAISVQNISYQFLKLQLHPLTLLDVIYIVIE